jgi:hypothetical protein
VVVKGTFGGVAIAAKVIRSQLRGDLEEVKAEMTMLYR